MQATCAPYLSDRRRFRFWRHVLGNVKYRVQHLQVAQLHVSTLHRQRILNSLILRFGNLHPALKLTEEPYISANTP
jgi:hypothetical protein